MTVLVKICGLKTREAVDAAVLAGADFLGFVFFEKSCRYISYEQARELKKHVPEHVKTVAVTVDPTDDEIKEIMSSLNPDYIQLHGTESVKRVIEIRHNCREAAPITNTIKAIPIKTREDIENALKYKDVADMLLFDAKVDGDVPGGEGKSFDWTLLSDTCHLSPDTWFLAGGLTVDNVKTAIEITGATMVDVSSGVESSRGIKDPELIKFFIKTAKS